MLEKSILVWQRELIICKKMVEILVINYQSEFSSNLLSMLVDIKVAHAHEEAVGSIRPSKRKVDNSCLAKAKFSRFIPLWLAFVGFTSSFFLKGRCMKKFGFFHKGFGFLKRKSEWHLHNNR